MKQKILFKNIKSKSKIRSKKGMSLVEILVAVAIVVIVFASTLGAMVSGYTTTVYNADENRAALLNSSANEIIFSTFKKMKISDSATALSLVEELENNMSTPPGADQDTLAMAVASAINEKVPGAVFVPPTPPAAAGGEYTISFADGVECQYTIIPDVSAPLSFNEPGRDDLEVVGIKIMTCFETAKGNVISESFMPYSK